MNHISSHGNTSATRDQKHEDWVQKTPASPSSFNTVLASAAREVIALHNVLKRLTPEDLQVLGSFPSQPHPLIHAIVACTHCLLLSCSAKHTNAPLKLLPWPLLRLELLSGPNKVLTKILKRMSEMQYGHKHKNSIVASQIRFVIRQLEPFHVQAAVNNNTMVSAEMTTKMDGEFPSTLAIYTRISTIGATLAAWVYLCLHYATVSPFRNLQLSKSPSRKPLAPVLHSKRIAASSFNQSLRMGMKIGSHYFLFQANRQDDNLSKPTYNVLRINVVSSQSSRTTSPRLELWKPFCAIPGLSESVSLYQIPVKAFKALVLQLTFHDNGFEALNSFSPLKRPVERPISSHSVAPLVMKCAIVRPLKKIDQLELLGIGSVIIVDKTTLLELRTRLEMVGLAKYTAAKGISGCNTSVLFLYRGALLAPSSERFVPAVALMPFALFCIATSAETPANIYRKTASLTWKFHRDVTHCLCNAGLPNHIPVADSSPTASLPRVTMYPLGQMVDSKTAHLVAGFCVSWTAFERFQQLQDSSIIYQLHSAIANKTKPKLDEKPSEDEPRKAVELPHRVRNYQCLQFMVIDCNNVIIFLSRYSILNTNICIHFMRMLLFKILLLLSSQPYFLSQCSTLCRQLSPQTRDHHVWYCRTSAMSSTCCV